MSGYTISPTLRGILDELEERASGRTETERAFYASANIERDDRLSVDHAIMRDGPGAELSPPAGADCVSRRLRP